MPHLLKKLELSGFKSFANKTVLEFPAGITAIVGPNGSGKSNVVDAIRWLLGERDAKNLRGGKGEDLIFAGTPKRARTGSAQASLHFDNHSKFFPIEYPEVSVMRQISRDGSNQYFLNRSEMLLRDLVDFYAKARLGSRGLIVVTQGNSDMFIKATPAVRREMVEEILGLREYQLKKNESTRRLKTTRVNLEKARALVDEILPHLRSLKRQTSRWERRSSVEEELRSLEDGFYGIQLRQYLVEKAQLEARLHEHGFKLPHLEQAKQEAMKAQAEIEEQQPQGRERLREIKEALRPLYGQREELQREVGKLEAGIEFEKRSVIESRGEFSTRELIAMLDEIKTELRSALEAGAENLARTVAMLADRIEEAFAPKKEAKKDDRAESLLVAKMGELSARLEEIDEKIKAFKSEEAAIEQSQEGFYAAFKTAVSKVERAKEEIELWERTKAGLEFEKEKVSLRLDELTRQIEEAGRRVEEFQKLGGQEDARPDMSFEDATRRMMRLRGELAAIGEIDEALLKEAQETEKRYAFLEEQSADLEKAVADLEAMIVELRGKIHDEFATALKKINEEFGKFFELMFGGGQAKLKLQSEAKKPAAEDGSEEAEEESEPGIEISLALPRRKVTSLEVLSGGEKSLVGIAALFALVSVSPPPFLVLDEIDAALDERNTRRFAEMLKEFAKDTQFIVVTHNRATMEVANVLYGVTVDEDGSSRVVSLKFEAKG